MKIEYGTSGMFFDGKELFIIPGHEDWHYATRDGEIVVANSRGKRGNMKFLKGVKNKLGYKRVYIDGKRREVHRLVASAFLRNPQNHPIVNHIDGNPSNNRPENLEWCTQSHNVKHAFIMGRKDHNGASSPTAKLTDEQVREIRENHKERSGYAEIGKKYGIAPTTVGSIIRSLSWTKLK